MKRTAAKAVLSDPPDLLGYLHNDYGNACRLIALYGDDLRYYHAFRKWLVWDGKRWAVDDTDQARRLTKEAMVEFFRLASESRDKAAESFARSSLDNRRITNALYLAECEICVRPGELDTDPYLLNFLVSVRATHLEEVRKSC